MPQSLQQYADSLETRSDLNWPVAPDVAPPKAKPHLKRLPGVKAILWDVYGTLLNIFSGDLLFVHPNDFIMNLALDKTITEFKMWKSMTRKPGAPAEYMRVIYTNILDELKLLPAPAATEKHPEILAEKIWEQVVRKLMQNEYTYAQGQYGPVEEYARKIAYFFHISMQGTACYAGAYATLRELREKFSHQGIVADGQCFTPVQLQRGLRDQAAGVKLDDLFDPQLCNYSFQVRGRKPSERMFKPVLATLRDRGIEPEEVLLVGNCVDTDIAPARRLGLRTALFAGDKESLRATPEQLKQPTHRPDLMLTELPQLLEVFR